MFPSFFFYPSFLSQILAIHRDHLYSSLPLSPTHEHSDIYLQFCNCVSALFFLDVALASFLMPEAYSEPC